MPQVNDLAALYRETVLAHSRQPHNRRRLARPDRSAEGHNRLCGDRIVLDLAIRGDTIEAIGFEATGCAIATASASMLTDAVQGRTVAEAGELSSRFIASLAMDAREDPPGELVALGGVRAYPSRVRCATLPWETLRAALAGSEQPVSTE